MHSFKRKQDYKQTALQYYNSFQRLTLDIPAPQLKHSMNHILHQNSNYCPYLSAFILENFKTQLQSKTIYSDNYVDGGLFSMKLAVVQYSSFSNADNRAINPWTGSQPKPAVFSKAVDRAHIPCRSLIWVAGSHEKLMLLWQQLFWQQQKIQDDHHNI